MAPTSRTVVDLTSPKAVALVIASLCLTLTLVLTVTPVVMGQSTGPPDRPTGLTGTVSHDEVALTWDDPGDDTITGYQILRRLRDVDDPGHFRVHVDDTGVDDDGNVQNSYVDRDVEAETRYVYRIKARNANGLSNWSSYFNAHTPAAPAAPVEEPPATPIRLRVLRGLTRYDRVVLRWDDPGDDSITGYQILRSSVGDQPQEVFVVHVDDTGSSQNSYTDTDVEPKNAYLYRIKARNAHGLSGRTGFVSVLVPPGGPAISNLAAGDDSQLSQMGVGEPQSFAQRFTVGGSDVVLRKIVLHMRDSRGNSRPVVTLRADGCGRGPGAVLATFTTPDIDSSISTHEDFWISDYLLRRFTGYWVVVEPAAGTGSFTFGTTESYDESVADRGASLDNTMFLRFDPDQEWIPSVPGSDGNVMRILITS